MFKIAIPYGARYILRLLEDSLEDAYIVGGCVRDSILGKTPHDWDICTSAKPGEVLALMAEHGIKTIETGLQHGTVTAVIGDESYEITTFRVDGEYSDNRRPDTVAFIGHVEEDLARRDFTINAMAYNEYEGFVDPYGGCGDLLQELVRCVGNPDDRFKEDGLRIMRALRFAATYGFKIEKHTAAAIHRNKDLLNNIAAERIQSELTRMLCGKGALDILLEYSDVMAVIIPELGPCIGFDQNNKYHIYNVYDHIAHAVDSYRGTDISIKMALLLHDIGKPHCYTEDHNGGHFHGHGVISHKLAKDVMERLRFDNKTKEEVLTLVLYHDAEIHPGTRSVKRWLNKVGAVPFHNLITVRFADMYAHADINRDERITKYFAILKTAGDVLKERQCFQIKDLAVNGQDIMSLYVPEGPIVGKVLRHLLDKVIAEEIENERDALMKEAAYYVAEDRHWQFCD